MDDRLLRIVTFALVSVASGFPSWLFCGGTIGAALFIYLFPSVLPWPRQSRTPTTLWPWLADTCRVRSDHQPVT